MNFLCLNKVCHFIIIIIIIIIIIVIVIVIVVVIVIIIIIIIVCIIIDIDIINKLYVFNVLKMEHREPLLTAVGVQCNFTFAVLANREATRQHYLNASGYT